MAEYDDSTPDSPSAVSASNIDGLGFEVAARVEVELDLLLPAAGEAAMGLVGGFEEAPIASILALNFSA